MPKLVHRVPSYRLHKRSGQAVVTLSGKDHYLGKHGTAASRREYDRLIGEYMQRGRMTVSETPGSTLICEIIAAYLDAMKRQKHEEVYRKIVLALSHVRKLYADAPASSFGPVALRACRESIAKEPRHATHRNLKPGGEKSRKYINVLTKHIVNAFKWAVAQEMIPVQVYQSLLTVEGLKRGEAGYEPAKVKSVPLERVKATQAAASPTISDMIELQLLTGCRSGELCQMRPMDIDRSADVWVYVPQSHKTEHLGKERHIYIGPKAQAVLAKYLLRAADAYCFSPRESEAKRPRRSGAKRTVNPRYKERYSTVAFCQSVKYYADKAKVERWHPHQLRHTAATEFRSKYGVDVAQVMLGHSDAQTTQIYAEVDRQKAMEVAKKIG